MAGTLVSYLPFTRSVTEDLSGKEWTVTGNPQIINRDDFSVPVAKFEANEYLELNNLTVGGNNHWIMDFWIYIPQSSSTHYILRIGEDDWRFASLVVSDSGELKIWQCTRDNLDTDYGHDKETSNTYFNKWINIKLAYNLYNNDGSTSKIGLFISDGTKYLESFNINHERSYITKTGKLKIGPNILLSQFRFYTRSNTYYIGDFIPNPPTDSGNVNIYLPTRQSFAWNELQVHDTVNFDYLENMNYTTYNKSTQWYYKNIGTADGLLVSCTSLTNVDPSKSVTSKAFYQTNRKKCFDTQASKEIYMLFDVYFDGTNRWRAYEESSTNGVTGITAQTSGVLDIFSNGTSVGPSIPLTINKLETYFLYMRSDATNGYIEVWKDREWKYTYIGNVNNGDDFNNLELQSNGSGTVFSNIVISNQSINDTDRLMIGNYNNIQYTLTNATWVKEKCLKALLPQIQGMDSCGNTWTTYGTTSFGTANAIHENALQLNKGYLRSDAAIEFGGADFTISFYGYMNSSSEQWAGFFCSQSSTATGNAGNVDALKLTRNSTTNNQFEFYFQDSDNNAHSNIITNETLFNTRHHFEIDYSHAESKLRLFIDGQITLTLDATLKRIGRYISLGTNSYTPSSQRLIGSIDEFQIYDGVALHTEDFTSPTTEDYTTYRQQLTSNVTFKDHLVSWLSFDPLPDLCGNAWLYAGNLPFITNINEINGKATQFGQGYIYTDPPALKSKNFTIDFWEYIPSTVNGLTAQMVVIDGTDGTGTQCLDIGYDNGATVPSFWLGKGASSGWKYSNKIIGTKIRGQWVHRAVVRYKDKIYAFENGQLYTSFDIEYNMYLDITGSSLFIGGFKRASRLHPGMLSEVRVYVGTALWTENFTPPNQEDYFETYWYFNKPAPILNTNYDIQRTLTNATWVKEKCLKSYLTTIDNSIRHLCGNTWNTYNNPSVVKTNTLNGKAISLSNNAYLQYQNGITLGGKSFTISGWFNMASNTGKWSVVFQLFTKTNSETNSIRIVRNSTNQNIVFAFYNTTLTGTTPYNISYNTWYHFAFVYDHTNSKVYIYINGEQIVSGNQTIPETNFTLWLGRSNYSADGYFVGQIAEFMIHNNLVLYTENFTPPNQEDYFETYWYFNKPAPILNTNYNILRYLTNDSQTWKYINPGSNDIDHFTYTNSSVTQVQPRITYTDTQVTGNIAINTDIYQELCIKFDIYLGNSLDTIFSFPYGKGTISISISKPESSTTYLAQITHEGNEENPIGTQLSPETSYSNYELGKIDEEISFIIYIKSNAYNKGEIMIDSSSWIDTDDNRRVALFSTNGRFHLNNANINEGNTLSKTLSVKCIYNLIVSNQKLTFDDIVAHNINPAQRSIINNEEWRMERYHYHTYLPFDESVTKDLSGDTWELTNTLDIQNNACYFNGSGYLWKGSNNLVNNPFTVSFYMSATSNNTGKEPYIFQLYASQIFGVLVYLVGCKITTTGKLAFCRNYNDDKQNNFSLTTSFSILDGKMHYIECIYTGSKCLFFVDGILIGTANAIIRQYPYGIYLGRDADTNTSFTGYLDEFRIYSDYIAHTENFTPPVYQVNNKLFYDKSAETMKFESFADIIKNVINIPLTFRNMFLKHYIPLHNDLDDKVNNVNTQFYSTIESVDAVFTNNSLNLQKYSSDGNEENNNYNGFGITNLTNLLKFKFILQARLFDVQFYQTPNGRLTNNIFSIFGQGFEQILLMAGHSNSLLFQANVGKIYSTSVSLINNFQLTIAYDYNNLQIIISSIDTNMDIIKTEVFYQIDLSQCQPDFNKNINEILFGSKVGSLDAPNAIHYLNEIKIYQDFNPDLSSNIIDNYITYQFNNNEESVYFEFYANIDLSKHMIINISPSILCWYYFQENKKLRIQGSQAFIPSNGFGSLKGVKDIQDYPSLEQYQFLEDSRTNSNIVYATRNLSIPPQIDYLPYTLFFWLISPCAICLDGESTAWALYPCSTYLDLQNYIKQDIVTIARNTASSSNKYIYHLALVLENSEASLYVNGSYVDTIYNLTFRGNWELWEQNPAMGFYGFGAIKGNIFKNGNVNLGYIGCPPSYVISTSDSQVSKPRLALQHNDKTYYNKLVSPTDENASKIHIYHNDTVYALSK